MRAIELHAHWSTQDPSKNKPAMETDHPLLRASSFDPFGEHYAGVQDYGLEFMLFDCGDPLAISAAADPSSQLSERGVAASQAVICSTARSDSPDELSCLQVDEEGDGDDIDDDDVAAAMAGQEDGNSGLMAASSAKARRDRSKTLISERKRRVCMKEKLYELRSLVPTISKMDKASIIADAVAYVKDLQSQAEKLEEEISALELSPPHPSIEEEIKSSAQNPYSRANGTAAAAAAVSIAGRAKITQVNAFEVGGGRFYVKVEGGGVQLGGMTPSSLYAAMESLSSCFEIVSSNFSLSSAGFVFIVTFKVGELSEEMNAACIELWVTAALLKEGFQLVQTCTSL